MSDFKKCPICNIYDWISNHKCPPKWKIFHKEYLDNDFKVIYAYNYEEAARKYGKQWDSEDYTLLDGDEIIIQIEPFSKGEKKTFFVTGESEPVYHAIEQS